MFRAFECQCYIGCFRMCGFRWCFRVLGFFGCEVFGLWFLGFGGVGLFAGLWINAFCGVP